MKIKKYYNTTKEELEAKKYNIFVPICVGNKFFLDDVTPTKNISNYIDWALNHTKEKIIILTYYLLMLCCQINVELK